MFNLKRNRWYCNLFFVLWIVFVTAEAIIIYFACEYPNNEWYVGPICMCFMFGVLPSFILYVSLSNKNKERLERNNYIKNHSKQNDSFGSSGSFGSKFNQERHSANNDKVPENGELYGWDECGEIAEYNLLKKFDEYIKLNFPFIPLEEYKVPEEIIKKIKQDIDIFEMPRVQTLSELAISMQKHLGYKENRVVVEIKSAIPGQRIAGKHERMIISFSNIVIYYSNVYSVFNVIQIMAHEMSHAFQQYYGHPTYNDSVDVSEKFTDALAIYLGFGNIYKNGQKYKVADSIYRLGYLSDNSCKCAYETYETRLVKEKPMRDYKMRFLNLQYKANQIIEGLRIHVDMLRNLVDNYNIDSLELRTIVNKAIKKYLETDFVQGCAVFLDNLIKYTEEEAKNRISYVYDELKELIEINQKLGR